MPSYLCEQCSQPARFTPLTSMAHGRSDIAYCANPACLKNGQPFLTDDADHVRKLIDRDKGPDPNGMSQAYQRSIALASAIYGLATHAEDIDYDRIEDHLDQMHGGRAHRAQVISENQLKREFARPDRKSSASPSVKTLKDRGIGVLVIPMTVGSATHVYVVFRGSRGDSAGLNPEKAGFHRTSSGGIENVDWQANLFNRQIDIPWGATTSGAKVHEGFLTMYGSVSAQIVSLIGPYVAGGATVVVTGHSLGAALTVLCAHHLQTTVNNCNPFCFPFNTPRVGNAAFVEDFFNVIAAQSAPIPPETLAYRRGINTIRENDPVSKGATNAYQSQMKKSQRRILSAHGGNAFTGGLAVVVKGIANLLKSKDSLALYYHTPNVSARHGWDTLKAHDYTKMQKSILGRALFKT